MCKSPPPPKKKKTIFPQKICKDFLPQKVNGPRVCFKYYFSAVTNFFLVIPLLFEIYALFQEPLEEDVNTEFNILRESTGKRRDLMLVNYKLIFFLIISLLVA